MDMPDRHSFIITIASSHPDAEAIARQAAEKIACELDWGDDQYNDIELLGLEDGEDVHDVIQTRLMTYLAGWAMEPGEDVG